MNLPTKEAVKAQREHLGCLCDYWPGDSDLERYGNAMEKMLIMGMAYGHGGQRELGHAAGALNLPPSHAKVVIDVLEGVITLSNKTLDIP